MSAGLRVRDLDAAYGRARALFGVSLEVAPGEAAALIGRNGAGKSTTFRAILGLLRERSGDVAFAGHDLLRLPTHAIVRLGLGYVPEDRRIFPDLTVAENLSVGRRPPRPGAPFWTPEKLFAIFPNLAELRHRPGARMSGGEQQMLAIARTLMGNPVAAAARRTLGGLGAAHRRADDRRLGRGETGGARVAGGRAKSRLRPLSRRPCLCD